MRTLRHIKALTRATKIATTSFQRRAVHTSVARRMSVNINGTRYWTDEEFKNAHRRGYEDAGGKWSEKQEERQSASHSRGEYTAEDIKAAFEKGVENKDQYVGAAIRGVWEKSFEEGRIAGVREESATTEQKVKVERMACEHRMNAQIEIIRRTAYEEGAASHPDAIKAQHEIRRAREEGHAAGEQAGRKQAEAQNLQAINKAKANAVSEYFHNKKWTTRFNRYRESVAESRKKQAAAQNENPPTASSKPKRSLKDIIGEIPITPHSVRVYRQGDHKLDFKNENGYRTNLVWSYSLREKYSIDKLRIKDIPDSRILSNYGNTNYTKATNILSYIMKYCCIFGISLAAFIVIVDTLNREADRLSHGETTEQRKTRESIESACVTLENMRPAEFEATAFTLEELEKLSKCKMRCDSLQPFHEKMLIEMRARRVSGYGDQHLFGKRKLPGVYDDDAKVAPLLSTKIHFIESVRLRVEAEKNAAKEKKDADEQAIKKQKYEEAKSKGLKK